MHSLPLRNRIYTNRIILIRYPPTTQSAPADEPQHQHAEEYQSMQLKLEATGHSIECITHPDHSIAFSHFVTL